MTAQEHIQAWIENHLSRTSKTFNNLPPCPYAKQSWLANKVLVLEDQEPKDYQKLLDDYEVIIYAYNPSTVTADQLYAKCVAISNEYIVALDDHPDNIEQVNDIILNNGEYALILVQERSKLEHARKILQSKGYYKNWDPTYLEEVLGE